jgi:dihydrofolate reductase
MVIPLKVKLLVTATKDWGIGNMGMIPWHIPAIEDRFDRLTIGAGRNAIIMGSKTWQQHRAFGNYVFPATNLPHRHSIVLSRHFYEHEGPKLKFPFESECSFFSDFIQVFCVFNEKHETIHALNRDLFDDIFVIGGADIFRQVLNNTNFFVDTVFVNRVLNYDTPTDCYFPFELLAGYSQVCESEIYYQNRYNFRYETYSKNF